MKRLTFLFILFSFVNLCFSQIVNSKREGEKYGFIDAKGKWVGEPNYSFTHWFEIYKMGYFQYSKDKTNGLINEDGKIVFPQGEYSGYEPGYLDKSYIVLIKPNAEKGLGTINGDVLIPCGKYDNVRIDYLYRSKSTKTIGIVVIKNGQYGYCSLKGIQVVPCKYENVHNDGKYITVDSLWKKGVYGNNGEILVPCEFNSIQLTADSIFLVRKNAIRNGTFLEGGKYGYYYKNKEIIPCIYDEASVFNNDVATVKKDGEVILIKNPLKDGTQIHIAGNMSACDHKRKGTAVSRYPAPDSDVDKNIPMTKKTADNTFAFIIANENYPDAPVPYSLNDGRMFREYCQKTLGMPEKNINLYEDATYGNIITAVEKMKQVADAYEGDASVIFYYAGHGFPDEKQSTAYLLPVDGNASDITTTGYSLAKLYKELAAMKLRSAVVFLDACFSGAKREDQMLSQSRGVAIKVRDEAPRGNMLVFSAAQGDETAHQLEEKHHGLFTYYLLKELQATSGDVDMGTLTEYVTKQVKRQSVVINSKKQTPTVIPSQALANNWQGLKLK